MGYTPSCIWTIATVASFLTDHIAVCLVGLIVLATVGWHEWHRVIRPRFIPKSEIARAADDLEARHGAAAEEIAHVNEDGAWRRSDPFERGRWRRVRRELSRRRECDDGKGR